MNEWMEDAPFSCQNPLYVAVAESRHGKGGRACTVAVAVGVVPKPASKGPKMSLLSVL